MESSFFMWLLCRCLLLTVVICYVFTETLYGLLKRDVLLFCEVIL